MRRSALQSSAAAIVMLLSCAYPAAGALPGGAGAGGRPGASGSRDPAGAAPGSRAALEVGQYDPSGRRDPFQPQAQATSHRRAGERRTPLQEFELSQLRLVAIIRDRGRPRASRAVVEDSAGLGYIMRVGTPIGRNDGRVTAIEEDRIVVEEWPVNVFGERRRTVIVKELDAGEEAKR